MKKVRAGVLAFLLFSGASLHADSFFYAVSSLNDLYAISLPGMSATFQFALGDGTSAFNGGLTFNPNDGMFYAISNDGFNNSVLNKFSLAGGGGAVTPLFDLGSPGFFNGLVFNSSDGFFYALSNDGCCEMILNKIDTSGGGTVTPITDVGFGGFMIGGLTFNPNDGLLYGILGDISGVSRELNSITTDGTASLLTNLGDRSVAYNGGLLLNPADGLLYAIANDMFGNSSLHSFHLDGSSDTELFALGTGFVNVGLTSGPQPIPEPSTLLLLGSALTAWAAHGLFRRAS